MFYIRKPEVCSKVAYLRASRFGERLSAAGTRGEDWHMFEFCDRANPPPFLLSLSLSLSISCTCTCVRFSSLSRAPWHLIFNFLRTPWHLVFNYLRTGRFTWTHTGLILNTIREKSGQIHAQIWGYTYTKDWFYLLLFLETVVENPCWRVPYLRSIWIWIVGFRPESNQEPADNYRYRFSNCRADLLRIGHQTNMC